MSNFTVDNTEKKLRNLSLESNHNLQVPISNSDDQSTRQDPGSSSVSTTLLTRNTAMWTSSINTSDAIEQSGN